MTQSDPTFPDYFATEPPAETAPEDYTTAERRAAVLRAVLEAGSPRLINQSRLAERFDVHRSTICRDLDRIATSTEEHLDDDTVFSTRAIYENVLEELLEAADDDWRAAKAAWDITLDWNEWVAERSLEDLYDRVADLEALAEETRSAPAIATGNGRRRSR